MKMMIILMVMGTFTVLALRGEIPAHDVMLTVMAVISLYYGSQSKY